MSKIEQTIQDLVEADGAAVQPARPFMLFAKWFGVTALSTAVITAAMTARPDLTIQLASPVFVGEVASLVLLVVATAIVSVFLCFPDLRQRPSIVLLPILPIAAFMALCGYRLIHPEVTAVPPPENADGFRCLMCISMFAAMPGIWMFYTLRRHATTHPGLAGAISLVSAASIGLLMLKFLEQNDSVLHLLEWHVVPTFLLAFAGMALGKKYLSW